MLQSQNIIQLKELFSPQLEDIDKIIKELTIGKSPLIQEISLHLINSGGKRIRPLLLLVANNIFYQKTDNKSAIYLAAAVEMIHNATLLHDDVVDNSEIRRGRKTANAIWDNKATILVGDFLFSIAFQLMVKCDNLNALSVLARASSIMADGEVMQLENLSVIDINIDKYIEIISGKTAILFAASTEVIAIINNCTESEVKLFSDFGNYLGIIFQIIDDILDYTASNQEFGKKIGNDFYEGKVTLPVIIALAESNEDDNALIKRLISENKIENSQDRNSLSQILEIFAKYDIINKSFNFAKIYYDKANDTLLKITKSDFNKISDYDSSKFDKNNINKLKIILDYALQRSN